MSKHTHRNAAKAQTLSAEACPSCGGPMKVRRARLKLFVNGEEIGVPSASHLKCPRCGEVMLRFWESRRLQQDAIEIYRRKHGLMSANEIRSVRKRLQLTQADLARLLQLGATTVSRWEAGRNVQSAAMDLLLRMMRDLPGCLEYLRRRSA